MLDLKRLRRFVSKDYRDEYLETTVRAGISYQISAIRSKHDMTQTEFALKLGKPQSVVSRLESTEYGRVTVQTLLDLAKALNLGLVVRFVDYPTFFRSADRMASADLAVDDIDQTLRKAGTHINPEWTNRRPKGRGNEVFRSHPGSALPLLGVGQLNQQPSTTQPHGKSIYEAQWGH